MTLPRFLYLAANDCTVDRGYSLRRIDMSRFFFRAPSEGAPTPLDSGGGAGATDPLAIEDAGSLPDPTLSLSTPHEEQGTPDLYQGSGLMDFILFKKKGHDGENLQLVTMDHTGSTLMCDPSLPPHFLPLPRVTPKVQPFSLTVGTSLYVMDAFPRSPNGSQRHSFEALSHGHCYSQHYKDWYWHSLPPPPYVYGPRDPSHYIESYAVVAGTDILISNKAEHNYRFDTI